MNFIKADKAELGKIDLVDFSLGTDADLERRTGLG
jgi:hypothetical protein